MNNKRKDNGAKKSIQNTLLAFVMFDLFCFIISPPIGAVVLVGSLIWLGVSGLGL